MNGNRTFAIGLVAALLGWGVSGVVAEVPYQVAWSRQIGTGGYDWARSAAVDGSGYVYFTGKTEGSLGGAYYGGSADAYLAKYSPWGNLQWSRQVGTSAYDATWGVTLDGTGGVYIAGGTSGNSGGGNQGGQDVFLSKYDLSGNLQWSRQIGTSADEWANGIAAAGTGGLYVVGGTAGSLCGTYCGGSFDGFLVKYDNSGNLVWSRQIGTSGYDNVYSVATDSAGGVYIAGDTTGSLGGPSSGGNDICISKYDASGNLQWSRQIGTPSDDYARSVATDNTGGLYITGRTDGSLPGPYLGGAGDAILLKYDTSGNPVWSRQIGTSSYECAFGVTTDGAGGVYIAGGTLGNIGGPNVGSQDLFLSKFDISGNSLWSRQLGSSASETNFAIAPDPGGSIYVSGDTLGNLAGPNAGAADAFLVKYEVPEPGALSLLALGWMAITQRRRAHS